MSDSTRSASAFPTPEEFGKYVTQYMTTLSISDARMAAALVTVACAVNADPRLSTVVAGGNKFMESVGYADNLKTGLSTLN